MAQALGDAGADVTTQRKPASTITTMKRLLLITALLVAATAARGKEVLPFIEDDYATAVARAKAKNVPIFVEAWAPW